MSVQIKALANGRLSNSTSDLYTVPAGKSTIVKNIRLGNTDGASRTLNLYFKRFSGSDRLISAVATPLAAGAFVIDDNELTMEAGDKIRGSASVTDVIDYIISGLERDVS